MLRQINIITAVWGAWHTEAFLSACLPSLFADGNLPALTREFECHYRIATDAKSAAIIRRSQAFAKLATIVDPELIVLDARAFGGDTLADAVRTQLAIWHEQLDRSKRERAIAILMGPDIVTADGSLRHIGRLFLAGKQAVYVKALRVVDETARRGLSQWINADGVMRADPRQLVGMLIDHLHPLTACHIIGSTRFAFHSEFLIRPIGREGFVLRLVLSDGFAFDMANVSVNQFLMADSNSNIAVGNDSDEFAQISLSPLCKDVDWYLLPNPTSTTSVARYWVEHDNGAADLLIDVDFVFRAGEIGELDLQQACADLACFVEGVKPRRDIIRVWRAIAAESGHGLVRRALAAAAFGIAGDVGMECRGPFTFFAPDDQAMRQLPGTFLDALMNTDNAEAWKKFVGDHVVQGTRTVLEGRATSSTISGRLVQLHHDNGILFANDVPLSGEPRLLFGGHHVCLLNSGDAPRPPGQ
jgi:hypothetical protein